MSFATSEEGQGVAVLSFEGLGVRETRSRERFGMKKPSGLLVMAVLFGSCFAYAAAGTIFYDVPDESIPIAHPTTATAWVPPTTTTISYSERFAGRDGLRKFEGLRAGWPELDSLCLSNFGPSFGDGADCFDAMRAEKGDSFSEWLDEMTEISISNSLIELGLEQGSGKRGCHSDGRCLDDFNVWCDESDISSIKVDVGEGNAYHYSACPASIDSWRDNERPLP